VLFIHGGFGGVESTLFPQPSVFSGVLPEDTFRTITYARRNSGRSGYSDKPYKVPDLAADARGLLDHLGIAKAHIVGDSLGGLIAMTFGLRWPERVSTLLLAETAPHMIHATNFTRAVLAASKVTPHRLMFKLARRRVMTPPEYDPVGPQTPESLAARADRRVEYLKQLRAMPEDDLFHYSIGLFHSYAAFVGYDITEDVHKLKMPVDIIHGTADRVVTFKAGELLDRLIPQATLHPMPGAGHGLFYYEPARQLARRLLENSGS
jgi:pimeloyl-ACP methyl ester carboxylesterase